MPAENNCRAQSGQDDPQKRPAQAADDQGHRHPQSLQDRFLGGKKIKELVLTDVDPFPGYYSETPGSDSLKPKMVFVAMKQVGGMYEDLILRAGLSIKEKANYKFEVNYGRFLLFNKMKPCVRIKIDDFEPFTGTVTIVRK